MDYGWLSLIPALLAVILAFITREPIVSLAVACMAGVLLMGGGLVEFPELLVRSLGTRDFIWICMIELCIGVLVAFYQRSGAVKMFTQMASSWAKSRKKIHILGWVLGMFIFFSDYFSPLFVGPVMRNMTDRARISREKLAYICDSTSAPMTILAPITGWAVYISGLLIGIGPIVDRKVAMSTFVKSIPFNFYSFLTIIMVGLISFRLIPDFGPMRRAEQRALKTGQVLRKGASSMMSSELTDLPVSTSGRPNIWLNFFTPVLIVITYNIVSFIITGQARVLRSFMLAVTVLGIVMLFQRIDNLRGLMKTFLSGIKGVMPAVLILAFAFTINTVSKEMGTAKYVVDITRNWLNPIFLPFMVFLISAFISFATGTAWGTYAIMIVMAVPLSFEFSQGQVTSLVLATIAAVAGGGIFGDHCSPLSDTTVLSSLGSACDHMDHVRTQLPYALVTATIASLFYIILGIMAVQI
jgi:Na+/H+ antiporter NhaC